jgi:hypothetical protein
MRVLLSSLYPIGSVVSTGRRCPESGSWVLVDSEPRIAATIAAGRIMPHYLGEDVSWRLHHYGA